MVLWNLKRIDSGIGTPSEYQTLDQKRDKKKPGRPASIRVFTFCCMLVVLNESFFDKSKREILPVAIINWIVLARLCLLICLVLRISFVLDADIIFSRMILRIEII